MIAVTAFFFFWNADFQQLQIRFERGYSNAIVLQEDSSYADLESVKCMTEMAIGLDTYFKNKMESVFPWFATTDH